LRAGHRSQLSLAAAGRRAGMVCGTRQPAVAADGLPRRRLPARDPASGRRRVPVPARPPAGPPRRRPAGAPHGGGAAGQAVATSLAGRLTGMPRYGDQRVDIDSFWTAQGETPEFEAQMLLSLCDELHAPVRDLFENLITPRLREKVLRGAQ